MPRYFTRTSISRLFSTPSVSVALITTVVDNGAYGAKAKSFKQIWATYSTTEPDNFQHSTDFESAIAAVAENQDDFWMAIARDPTAFAETVAIHHQMGSVISQHKMWDSFPEIELSFRVAQLDGPVLQFYTHKTDGRMPPNSCEITKILFNIDTMATEFRSQVKSIDFR